MKRTVIIAGAVLVVAAAAAGGAYALARQRAAERMDAAVAEFRASLPPGWSLGYASASPQLFSRSGHFTGVTLTMDGQTVTAATLDVSPGEGRTLRHLAATQVAAKDPDPRVGMDRFEADALTLPATATSLADIDLAAVSFDHAAAHGVHVVPDEGGSMDAADVTVDGYGAGRPTTIDLAGFAANLNATAVDHVGLDHARLRGLMLADLIAQARSGAPAWPHGLDYDLDLSKLSVTAGGKPFVTFASLSTASTPKGPDQIETRFDLTDLVVIATPGLTPGLSQLGYDRFQGGMQMHAVADRAAGQMRMDRLDLDAPAMGRLHLALGLDNIPYSTIAPASGQVNGMAFLGMLQARLQSAELTYEDRSLVGKAFAAAAAEQNTTPAALKQAAIAMVNATGAQLHLGSAVLDPVVAFINDPHRLAVTVRPPQPVALIPLARLAADPQRVLGLTVSN